MNPNYIKIYSDLIRYKYPEKIDLLQFFKDKQELTAIDVLTINRLLFGDINSQDEDNPLHKAYDIKTINFILDYQKENILTNVAVSKLFQVSRNTIAKWKNLRHESKL